jgi:hypothetical protein
MESCVTKSQKEDAAMAEKGKTRTYRHERRKCGKHEHCKTCQNENGHGPYWYVFFREGGKLKSKYLGLLKDGQTVEDLDAEKMRVVLKPVNRANLAKLDAERKQKQATPKPAPEAKLKPAKAATPKVKKPKPAPAVASPVAMPEPSSVVLGFTKETATTLAEVLATLPDGATVGTTAANMQPVHDFTTTDRRADQPAWYRTAEANGRGQIKLDDPTNPFSAIAYTYVLPA